MYDEFCFGDVLKIASHTFDRRTLRCTNKINQGDGPANCNRHLNDVLSEAADAAAGANGISCWGQLNQVEAEQIQRALELRRAALQRGSQGA